MTKTKGGRMNALRWMLAVVLLGSCSSEIDEGCKNKLTSSYPILNAFVGSVLKVSATHSSGDSYDYVIGVCTDIGEGESRKGCGAMQYGSNNNNNHTHCLGNISHAQVTQSRDKVWIELTYSSGDPYRTHCGKTNRTARLIFFCDPYVTTNAVDFLEENNQDDLCYYLFNIASRTVCGYPGNLSVGDIILILIAALLFLWVLAMVGGTLYKRFIMGAKGWEQVPLLNWYAAFGNLEADGCDLVCRTRRKNLVEYKEPSFGADTDEEDDEKDDNLLPM